MNRIFRIIWSKALRTWVVASEFATRDGKGGGGSDQRGEPLDRPSSPLSAGGWRMRACAVAVLLALHAPAWATDMYWDFNGFNPSTMGGTGTWDLTSQFWDYGAVHNGTTGPYQTWDNTAWDDAFFQGTAGTVTLAQPINVHNLTFNVHNYVIQGGQLTLGSTTPTIYSHGNTIIDSVIAGSAGLTKEGNGTLTLNGTNTFSGGIFLNAGTLSADDNAALGAFGNTITTKDGVTVGFAVGTGTVDRTVVIGSGGTLIVSGAAGTAQLTGDGSVSLSANSTLSNDTNTYTGSTRFNGCNTVCNSSFTSIADLGIASSLGAPTDAALGTILFAPTGQYSDNITYTGDGDSSNRNWAFAGGQFGRFYNSGTGALILTGDMALNSGGGLAFIPATADMQLLGQLSGVAPSVTFAPTAGRTLTLGGNNSFTGTASITDAGMVVASVLANAGSNSSLGAGNDINLAGTLSYTGGVATTDRDWTASGTLNNDGTGALTLTGDVAATGTVKLGGAFGGVNTISGVISGTGGLRSNGVGTWLLSGANTFSGAVTVSAGTLRAGSAAAFGDATAFTVNGGTLDLNGFGRTISTLNGSGGTVALGSGTLTVDMASGTSTYSGAISGSGGLTKLGRGTLTLRGANTYTGATTVNNGTLALDFAGAGGPADDIISDASALSLGGGVLDITGANGEANSQSFAGLDITAGSNTLRATSGTGAGSSMTVDLGAITRAGGIVNFVGPASGAFLTSNANGALGGWATITTTSGTTTTTDYAEVVGGQIVAFDDYENQDDASLWQDGQFLSDEGGTPNTAFFNTVGDSKQIAGLKYTAGATSVVNVGAGQTLGLDGTIIVNATTNGFNQAIQGGSLTGAVGGGTLGVLKNSNATFTIASDIVDNGGAVGFTVGGTGGGTGGALGNGTVSLTGNNTYTGATTVSGATLAFNSVANGGSASAIGAASSDASNLVLENGTLRYTGATGSTDRGFTLVNGGVTRTIQVTEATTNLTFSGQVTSPDDAGFTKSGAGTLTLSNAGNDYVGVTTVSGGTLSVDDLADGGQASSIGASSSDSANLVLLGGGTLQYTGASVTTDRGFTLGTQFGGVLDVSNAGTTLEFGGTVAGGAGAFLTKAGAGTLVLSGTNTYAAQTFVDEGVLRAGSMQAFSANIMNLADVAGATLDLGGFDNKVGGLQGGGATGGNVLLGDATLAVGGYNASFSGSISGTGGLTKEGGGTQTLVGCNNSYAGPTTVTGGTLSVDCLRDGGVDSGIGASDGDPSSLVISSGGTLEYTGGSVSIDRGIGLAGGDGYVSVASAGTILDFSGLVTGAGRLRKTGDGALMLSGANDYTGNTVIDAGTLLAGSAGAFGTGGILFTGATATLDLNDIDSSVRFLQSTIADPQGTIRLGGATLTIAASGSTYSGVIEGAGSLVKSGGGHQALTGCSSTYDGSTTIDGSTLSVSCLGDGGAASSIGDSSAAASNLVITGNGDLRYIGDGDSTDRQFTMGGSAILEASGGGAIEYTSTASITMTGTAARTLRLHGSNTGDNTLAAQIDDPSASTATTLRKTGAGTWVLGNEDSTYTGVTRIEGGVLSVSKLSDGLDASSIGASNSAASNLVIGAGATLRYVGTGDSTDRQFTLLAGTTFIESSGTGTIDFRNTGAATLSGAGAHTVSLGGTNTGFNTFGGTLADASASGKTTLSKYGTGTWVLTGDNTYTGDTVINQGNLMIGNGGTTGNAGAGNVFVQSADSTLSFNRADTFEFAGSLTGAGNIAQIGGGTTVLTAASNSIGGVTGVGAGTLQVAGGSNLTAGAATVDAGTLQVLAGGSLTTPTIAMNAGSTLDVGGTVQAAGGAASAITGDGGDSTINVDAGGTLRANGDLGGGGDLVNIAGTLDTGAAKLNLGDGDDTLAFTEGAALLGAGVDAGAGGNDTLRVDHTSPLSFDAVEMTAFETLVKQNTGALTLTGNQTFDTSVQIQGGSLDVGDGGGDSLVTAAVTMADGTTLNVNGMLQNAGGTTATLTGSAGANAVNVAGGATLAASGDLGDGDDTVASSGLLDTGAGVLGLGAGDDTLTLHDGAAILGAGVDAGAQSTDDTLILDNALGLAFDGGRTANFERLVKQNTGTATMTGIQGFASGTEVLDGVLGIDAGGDLATPTVTMADGTGLQVDGTLQGGGGTATTIAGSDGAQTVKVNGTAIATGDLGGGNDTLDVAGTLDIGGGVFALGDGDDSFVVHDGTHVLGTIDGGAGEDTRVYDIDGVADLGALVNFEGVTKTGAGTLSINGPGATDLLEVQVQDGTLDIGAGASVVAKPGEALATTVGGGATLNVDGSFGCGGGADTMTVSGTVSGSGSIDLCGGDDTLTLNDGAVLAAVIDGGAHSTADRLVLNNAGAMAFDGAVTLNFEILQKDNSGEATLTGSAAYTGGTLINGGALTVDAGAVLTTPTATMGGGTTLDVGGTLEGMGGAAATIAGGAGVQTVAIDGAATATGDLGAGNDVLDVAGTLDTGGGVFVLGDGDDQFVVYDGTSVNGTIDGGAGLDSRVYDIDGTAEFGALLNFEGVTKNGTGTLNISGPGATDLEEVQVLGGTLNVGVTASVVGKPGRTLATTVGAGATLNVEGSFGCSDGADSMSVSGTVSGGGTIDLCGGDDTLTLGDGAVLANVIDGGAHGAGDRVVLDNAAAMTFDGANTVNFEILQKENTGEATLTGAAIYSGGAELDGGTLVVGAGASLTTPTVTMTDDTTLDVDGSLQGAGGAATIAGSAGINTVDVAAGATLTAVGDLGDGNDVLDAAGTIDTGGGVLSLGAGDDAFNVYDTTDASLATIDGGAGTDLLDVNVGGGNTVPLGGLTGFESLGKSGDGTLEIHGASSFIDVDLDDGTLRVTGTGGIAAQNTTILSGATLDLADGGTYSGTAGDDTFTIAGTVVSTGSPNTGRIDLAEGNDVFTIQDGADLSGLAPEPVSGGAGTDTFVADLAGTATLGGALDFETLTKTNTGTLVVAGPAASSFTTVNVDGGLLDIGAGGSLTGVREATVASGATLNVDGAFGFTTGADSFTVAGTVTGTSAIDMLAGDDTFTLQDGADLSGLAGPVDGGDGDDTFVSDLAGTATLGGAVNFETLDKTNTGTLVVAGPAASAFTTVNVAGGTLDVAANGSLDGVVTGSVASGTTFNVDGRYTGSAGDDTLTVAGAMGGGGNIALGEGDDTLTLNDGADLGDLTGVLDGGAHGGGDRVVLDSAGALTFDAGNVVNFEFLQKAGAGQATLAGDGAFGGGTRIDGGTLAVTGNLVTPGIAMGDDTALDVGGGLAGGGSGATAVIAGSGGVNTVTIGGTANAIGDLGAGNDVLDVAGMLDTGGGAFMLGDGDDDFVVHDGTVVVGTIDGGAGMDSRVYDIAGTAEFGALASFEGVTKRGSGTLNISGPDATDLQSVEVEGGTLDIGADASVVATAGMALDTVVAGGATLSVDGSFGCGGGDDTMTVAGTVSGTGVVAMCGGDDTLRLQDGATLATAIDGGADTDTVVLDTGTAMSFDGARTTNFEVLQKDGAGQATLTGTASYTGGTLLHGGTLTVDADASLTTPTVALADDTTLDVGGALQGDGGAAKITGSAGANTVHVGGNLLATGDLGGGDDLLDVSGTLDTGDGSFGLGDGDDMLTIHDGTNVVGTVVAGAGNDTFNTDIATNADLGAVQGFETLSKTGVGTLDVNGPASSDFTTVNVLAGTLNVASAGSITAQDSTVAEGATLQIDGSYLGTEGDDTFTSNGTVRGALAFGGGDDTVRFIGGDISGLAGAHGGGGAGDLLSFSGLELDDDNVVGLAEWERVELLGGSALMLGTGFMPGGVLAIDGTSQLLAKAGASIGGSVENAGRIDVGGDRLAIGGDYISNAGALTLTVSAGGAASGGLDVAGDVVGTTSVTFDSDGSVPAADTTEILVIASPNDDAATAGGFAPAGSADGRVRLDGSPFAWKFGQEQDRNWYLSTEAAPEDVLPEITGYGVLPGLGVLMGQRGGEIAHQRMAGVRGAEPRCGGDRDRSGQAGTDLFDDCNGAWMAATGTEVELGADPGFEVSGDDTGLYAGIDGAAERGDATLRGGAYLGYLHSVYWATGVNSSAVSAMGPARVELDTPIIGLYGTSQWANGNYVDLVLTGQNPRAKVRATDGFSERIEGDTLSLSARFGHRYRLDGDWVLEPQLQLSASRADWDDKVDAAGRELRFDDDLVGGARAALRAEKALATAGGAQIRPWAELSVRSAFGGNDNGLRLAGSGVEPNAFPGHDLGTSAHLDVGLEATLDRHVSFFGVFSVAQDLEGSDYEQRGVNAGLRVRW